MATALLAAVFAAPVADIVVGSVLFIWFCVALVMMFASGRLAMPLVAALGWLGAILLALAFLWRTRPCQP